MKRAITFLLALALLLTLAACGAVREKAGGNDREIDTTRSFFQGLTLIQAAETEDTIYFISKYSDVIRYVDKATGVGGPLCGRPDCLHNDKSCNAYAGGSSYPKGLFIYDSRLYWINNQAGSGFVVYSAALDGTDHREEAVLGRDLTPNSNSNLSTALFDGYVLIACERSLIEDGEDVRYNYLCAIPLESEEEPFVILQEKTEYNYTVAMQLYDGGLYIITDDVCGSYEDFVKLDQSDRRYDFKIRRWDMKNRELETVYEEEESTIYDPAQLWVTDDYILFTNVSMEMDERQIYKYDFETGACGYLFSSGLASTWGVIGITDGIVSGYPAILNGEDNEMHVVIRDFDGNVLTDEVYELDLGDGFGGGNFGQLDLLGRDEDHIYYSIYTPEIRYTAIVSVALDGSGARVMCTETEDN